MKKLDRSNIITIIVDIVIGLVIALLFMGDVFGGGLTTKELIMALANALFVPAILLIGLGLLSLISVAGGFYAIQYLGYAISYTFGPKKSDLEKKNKDYYTFCEEKKAEDAKKGGHTSIYIMLGVGIFYLVICLIFTGIFYLV